MRMTTEEIKREDYRLVNDLHNSNKDGSELRSFRNMEWISLDEFKEMFNFKGVQ